MFVFRPRSRKTQRLYYLKYGKDPVQVWENRVCHQWKTKNFSGLLCPESLEDTAFDAMSSKLADNDGRVSQFEDR